MTVAATATTAAGLRRAHRPSADHTDRYANEDSRHRHLVQGDARPCAGEVARAQAAQRARHRHPPDRRSEVGAVHVGVEAPADTDVAQRVPAASTWVADPDRRRELWGIAAEPGGSEVVGRAG